MFTEESTSALYSSSLQEHPELAVLAGEVGSLLVKVAQVSSGIEGQMDVAHDYWSAAAEDVASSSRDWAAIHSGVRTQRGM